MRRRQGPGRSGEESVALICRGRRSARSGGTCSFRRLTTPTGSGRQIVAEAAAHLGRTELLQRLRLDLAYALAAHAEAGSDQLERVRLAVPQPEAHLEHQL